MQPKQLTPKQIKENRKNALVVLVGLVVFVFAASAILRNKEPDREVSAMPPMETAMDTTIKFDTVAPTTSTYPPSAPIEMPSTPKDDEMHNNAYEIAKDFVEDNLKSPSSASFWRYDFNWSKLGYNEYYIQSFVDAENSFGAKLKAQWNCKLKYTGGDIDDKANWQLLDINISE